MSVSTGLLRALAGRWDAAADDVAGSAEPQAVAEVAGCLPGSRSAWVAGQVGQIQADRLVSAVSAVHGLARNLGAVGSAYDATDDVQAQTYGAKAGA